MLCLPVHPSPRTNHLTNRSANRLINQYHQPPPNQLPTARSHRDLKPDNVFLSRNLKVRPCGVLLLCVYWPRWIGNLGVAQHQGPRLAHPHPLLALTHQSPMNQPLRTL